MCYAERDVAGGEEIEQNGGGKVTSAGRFKHQVMANASVRSLQF